MGNHVETWNDVRGVEALAQGPPPVEPSVVFQPIFDLMTGKAAGYEALSRLRGQEAQGYPALEAEARRQRCLTSTLRRAQQVAIEIGAGRPANTLLFLNATTACLRDLQVSLAAGTLSPENLVVELPEKFRQTVNWGTLLAPIRANGVEIAMDDWGVGLADSLRTVRLKPNWLKIDRSLICQIGIDPDVDRLIEMLVQWTEDRGARLIAEGCETAEQVDRLRLLGVRFAQGFFLARPGTEWVRSVELRSPGQHMAGLHGMALSIARTMQLNDQKLHSLEKRSDDLRKVIDTAVYELVAWIRRSPVDVHLVGVDLIARYTHVLSEHLHALTRGELAFTDVDRATRVAQVHIRIGVDLAWYSAAHRELQTIIARELRSQGQRQLAEAMRAVLGWDMAVTLDAFQKLYEVDMLTSVYRRRFFWNRATALLERGIPGRSTWVLILVHFPSLTTLRRAMGRQGRDHILQQIGEALQSIAGADCIIGRMDAEEFALFVPYRDTLRTKHDEIKRKGSKQRLLGNPGKAAVAVVFWRTRRDSNPRKTRFRKPPLYPPELRVHVVLTHDAA